MSQTDLEILADYALQTFLNACAWDGVTPIPETVQVFDPCNPFAAEHARAITDFLLFRVSRPVPANARKSNPSEVGLNDGQRRKKQIRSRVGK